ncbi:MAG: hypothetical protein US94_C0001G0051 [Berkelbacteria bacterium GW2011_GWB1_38_5]|uniref:Transposase IS200-like domain-containing protein n=2 Tax=Candidatus Berkelbacteria TaxID=1618330 RepID=A0A0G0LIN7_9BACT|nr:MAG: hypothetical protein US94_C0001G0051 [Berkelbacteria bacterium GW2011_GWB1_38_5]KKQ90932.1 MAG: hypothetical protein UT15_C0002G0005 [Berkelbacteria bacterium GW2011_GWA1_39_10]
MYVKPVYANDHLYHVYNRGVAKQNLFDFDFDYLRLLKTFSFYLENKDKLRLSKIDKTEIDKILRIEPQKPLVEIYAYCLMPNHFHLLLRQIVDNGISIFMRRSLDSYTRYYNEKNDRVGTLTQGRFRVVMIESDEQLIHLSRYLHLNPYTSGICNDSSSYSWSSYHHYLNNTNDRLCHSGFILKIIGSPKNYREFVEDYASYARDLTRIKDLLHE